MTYRDTNPFMNGGLIDHIYVTHTHRGPTRTYKTLKGAQGGVGFGGKIYKATITYEEILDTDSQDEVE